MNLDSLLVLRLEIGFYSFFLRTCISMNLLCVVPLCSIITVLSTVAQVAFLTLHHFFKYISF